MLFFCCGRGHAQSGGLLLQLLQRRRVGEMGVQSGERRRLERRVVQHGGEMRKLIGVLALAGLFAQALGRMKGDGVGAAG